MIVILEGAERTGKSSVAEAFEKAGYIRFKDYNHFKEMDIKTIRNRLDATLSFIMAADKAGINVVMDRFHISEKVYAQAYRRREPDPSLAYMDTILSKCNTVLIQMVRHVDDNFISQHPVFEDGVALKILLNSFSYECEKSEIKTKYVFDLENTTAYQIVNKVESDMRGVSQQSPYLGHEQNNNHKYDIYLASPFFNSEQIERMEAVLHILRGQGLDVYAPYEHGIVKERDNSSTVSEIFNSNVEAIKDSKYIVAITDGKDMGTIWEAGYAYGIGKKIIYFAETLGERPFNIMLSESGVGIFKTRPDLAVAAMNGNLEIKYDVAHQ